MEQAADNDGARRKYWEELVGNRAQVPGKVVLTVCTQEVEEVVKATLDYYLDNSATFPAGVRYNEASSTWETVAVRGYDTHQLSLWRFG